VLLFASLTALLALAPPDFLAGPQANSIHQLFRGDAVAVSQSRLDMTGDGQRERIVVVGRPGPTGVLFPIGLVVIEALPKNKRTPRFRILASAVLNLNPAYDARSGIPFSAADRDDSFVAHAGDPMVDELPGDPLPGDPLPGDPLPGDPLPGDPLPGDLLPGAFPDNAQDLDGDGRAELMLHTRARGPQLSELAVTWWQLDGDMLRPIYHLQRRWVTRHGTERRSMTVVAAGLIEERIETIDSAGMTSIKTMQLVYDRTQRKFVAPPGGLVRAPAE
jgi:hypothetical protein